MLQAAGDLWKLGEDADAIVITTNGTIKRTGQAVMGRGCAKEAALRFPDLPDFLGQRLQKSGNHVHLFPIGEPGIITYPVKHEWWQLADLGLISRSGLELSELADERGFEKIVMPRPGCGNGGQSWWKVEDLLQQVLDDRFTAVTWGEPDV